MTDMDAFDRLIAREVVHASAPPRPVDDAAIFTAITAIQSPKWRFQSMFSATKFVVAGAIVALFGGFLLAGVLTQRGEDQAPLVGATTDASPNPNSVVTDVFEAARFVESLVGGHGAIWTAGEFAPVQRVDPLTGEVIEVLPEGSGVHDLVVTGDAVWATGERLTRIDPTTGAVSDALTEVVGRPLVVDGSLWVPGSDSLYEVDTGSRELVNVYGDHGGDWAAAHDGGIWLWFGEDWTGEGPPYLAEGLVRFDVATREFSLPYLVPTVDWGFERECCVLAEDAIWLIGGPAAVAMRFDLTSLEITDTIDLDDGGRRGIGAAGAVWIPQDDGIIRIDSQTREISDTIGLDGSPLDQLVSTGGAIWAVTDSGVLHRIDPGSRSVTHRLDIDGEPSALAEVDGDIWVAAGETVKRVSTMAGNGEEASERFVTSDPSEPEGTSSTVTAPDLLPGVDLVTEEVEPGVYRVLSDGVRDIPQGRVLVGLDGSVLILDDAGCRAEPRPGPCQAIRLGDPESVPLLQDNPVGCDECIQRVVWVEAVGQDGTIWATTFPLDADDWPWIISWDGERWTGHFDATGRIRIAADGRVFAGIDNERHTLEQFTGLSPRMPQVDFDEWDASIDGSFILLRDGERNLRIGPTGLEQLDGEWFAGPSDVHARVGVSPEGVFWYTAAAEDDRPRSLVSYDGDGWVRFDIPEDVGGHPLAVTRDGSVWLGREDSGPGGASSDGVHRFDGSEWTRFLTGHIVTSLGESPDGTLWVTASSGPNAEPDLYVITPEAVAE